jgi:hypothetical protein
LSIIHLLSHYEKDKYASKERLVIAAICISMYSGAGELPALTKDKITMETPEKPSPKDNELTAAEKKLAGRCYLMENYQRLAYLFKTRGVAKMEVENGTLMFVGGVRRYSDR